MILSNFIHLNSIPLMDDELRQVLNLNLNYFNPDEECWSWTDNRRSMDIDLNENDSFITNIKMKMTVLLQTSVFAQNKQKKFKSSL